MRWHAFGWHAIVIDGHDMEQVLDAYQGARDTKGKPTVILARTLKGKGVSFTEGQPGWHGKAMSKDQMEKAFAELESQFVTETGAKPKIPSPPAERPRAEAPRDGRPRLQAGRPGRHARSLRRRARQARRRRSARRRARRRREELHVQRQVRSEAPRSLLSSSSSPSR